MTTKVNLRRRLLLIAVSLCAVLALSCLLMGHVSAEEATSGKTGNCPWKIENSVLTIGGEGNYQLPNATNDKKDGHVGIEWPWSYGHNDITKIVIIGSIKAGDTLEGFFGDFGNLTEIEGLNNLDTSQTKDFSGMFSGCHSLKELDLSSFDTNKCESMDWMFFDTGSINKINFGKNFKFTSKGYSDPVFLTADWEKWVKDEKEYTAGDIVDKNPQMEHPGWYTLRVGTSANVGDCDCPYTVDENYVLTIGQDNKTYHLPDEHDGTINWPWAFEERNVSMDAIDYRASCSIKKVVIKGHVIAGDSLAYMFASMNNVKEIDGLENIDTSKTTSLDSTFCDCPYLEKLDGISNWKTSNVTNMHGTFEGSDVATLDLSKWDTSKVNNTVRMFFCSGVENLCLNKNFKFYYKDEENFDNSGLPERIWQLKGTNNVYTAKQMMTQNPQQKNPGWYVDSKLDYIIDEADKTWTQNSDGTMTFHATGEFEDFKDVLVDGQVIDKNNYDLKKGSTVVILKTSYLKTLSPTTHTLKVLYKDGKETQPVSFEVKKKGDSSSSGGSSAVTPSKPVAPVKTQTMYRLYNPYSGEHFYTKNQDERNHLISIGWKNEGVGWIAPQTSDTPVYRLYNHYAGEHHYTMNAAERDNLVKLGWTYEGIGWYSGGKTPVYREYNPNAYANNHNYTPNKAEHDHLISLGWRNENIGWYAEAAK